MENKELQEFWEWCGWKIVKDIGLWRSIRPDGTTYMSTIDEKCIPVLFEPLDLNNLFKYAVPKLLNVGYDIAVSIEKDKPVGISLTPLKIDKGIIVITENGETFEEALYQAMQKARRLNSNG